MQHKNLDKIHFRAYPLDLMQTIEKSRDYNLLPDGRELAGLMEQTTPSHQWELSLPATPDYRMHRTFTIPPMTASGTYLILASARPDFSPQDNRIESLYLTLSQMALVARDKYKDSALEITVLSGSDGTPIAGAEVSLYESDYQTGYRKTDAGISDAFGIVTFPIPSPKSGYVFVARRGDQVTWDSRRFYWAGTTQSASLSSALFFTDRSLYRPTQKILWKTLLYRRNTERTDFSIAPQATCTVFLKDKNGQIVESREVTTNEFGTASGEFSIPSGRTLGVWNLESSWGGGHSLRVEEYKRPTFEVKILEPTEPRRIDETIQIRGEARYLFGRPIVNGRITWTLQQERVLVPMTAYYYPSFRVLEGRPRLLAGGTGTIDPDGTFVVSFTPVDEKPSGRKKDVVYQYSFSAEVTEEGGETQTVRKSMRIGSISVRAHARPDKGFFPHTGPVEISVWRSDLDGRARSGQGTWRIVALKGPGEVRLPAERPLPPPDETEADLGYQTPGDRERERWMGRWDPWEELAQWESGTVEASGSVSHDAEGKGRIVTDPLPPGAYRLLYETPDDFGQKCRMQREFLVFDSTRKLPLPALLAIENSSVRVGESARILAYSGIEGQSMVLETYQDSRRIHKRVLLSGSDPSVIELPVTEKDRGGLRFCLSFMRDHQWIRLEDSLSVPWDSKELKVEFSTFRNRIRTGGQESWNVRVTGPAGKETAVPAAELLVYMYDRSLDLLAPHTPARPGNLFPYRAQSTLACPNNQTVIATPHIGSGFRIHTAKRDLRKDQLLLYCGYPIGGMAGSIVMSRGAGGRAPGMVMEEQRPSPTVEKMDWEEEGEEPIEIRSNFHETSFWMPHLITGQDGSVTFEFKVPDSITSWKVWAHAVTKDLQSGAVSREVNSIKDLMVRPYLPRFLREGDRAEIKVLIHNATDRELQGSVRFDIIDTATDRSILTQFVPDRADAGQRPFQISKKGDTTLTFPIRTPVGTREVAFRITATSGEFSDGELRTVPVLPGRMHLMQSRSITLKGREKRTLRFEDMAKDHDATRRHERMVVSLDGQLFYSVLSALPYLVDYPYECTERTLNAFLSTGILSTLYRRFPALDRMAREFSARPTRLETWNEADPNRRILLEETPWLTIAGGGDTEENARLISILDSDIAATRRKSALAELRRSQTALGGFPWFPGGPPSPYMTLYMLHGFSKAMEFGMEIPEDMTRPAWNYLHRHYLDDMVRGTMQQGRDLHLVTFVNYVLSMYPNNSRYQNVFSSEDRKAMLNYSYQNWRLLGPYLKGYLALTLHRMGRTQEARLVWQSVLDSAVTSKDQGTFWAPEDCGWLWYNDRVESHASAIRIDLELFPEDPKLEGMVQWLLLHKKANHWKSTRATAEVIYSLAQYFQKTGSLGTKETVKVTAGSLQTIFVMDPDAYTGKKNRIVIAGDRIDPRMSLPILVEKTGKGHLFASATWHFSTERMPEADGNTLQVSRRYCKRVNRGKEFVLQPLEEGITLVPGDEVEVQLSLRSRHPMEYVHLRDPRAAGFEPATSLSQHKRDGGISWYEEIRDSATNFFFEQWPQGEYTFRYRIRAATAGTFRVAPATAQPLYAPEFSAYSSGASIRISSPGS